MCHSVLDLWETLDKILFVWILFKLIEHILLEAIIFFFLFLCLVMFNIKRFFFSLCGVCVCVGGGGWSGLCSFYYNEMQFWNFHIRKCLLPFSIDF